MASLVGHLVLVGAGAYLVSAGFGSGTAKAEGALPEPSEVAVDVGPVQAPAFHVGPSLGDTPTMRRSRTERVAPGGGEPLARPDMDRAGRGGSLRAEARR